MRKDVIYREDAIDAAKHAWAKGLEPTQYIELVSPVQSELVNDSPELNKLFGELKEKYEWAKRQEWIFNPLGYALYYVWKEYDERGELL